MVERSPEKAGVGGSTPSLATIFQETGWPCTSERCMMARDALGTPEAVFSMKQSLATGTQWASVWIPTGAGLFIIALTVSAVVVPPLRLLHFLQALIYVAVIVLARRNHAGAFGAGVTIATVWNSLQLFISHLMQAGAREFWSLLQTGHVRRPDTMMVALGGVGHFVLIIGCVAAFLQLPGKRLWGRFVTGGVVVLAYFALIVFVALPRR